MSGDDNPLVSLYGAIILVVGLFKSHLWELVTRKYVISQLDPQTHTYDSNYLIECWECFRLLEGG